MNLPAETAAKYCKVCGGTGELEVECNGCAGTGKVVVTPEEAQTYRIALETIALCMCETNEATGGTCRADEPLHPEGWCPACIAREALGRPRPARPRP